MNIVFYMLIVLVLIVGFKYHRNILNNILYIFATNYHEKLTHSLMIYLINKFNIEVMIDAGAWLGDTCIPIMEQTKHKLKKCT